jgi:single-strand DNA-binding protein
MAGNLNKVFLMGNLTRDPELRHTAQGSSVTNFSVAVNRAYKGSDGELKKEVSYFNIVVWGKMGENCAKYLTKGRPVLVEGRLQNRSWDAEDGTKRHATDIVADNVQFLGSASSGGSGGSNQDNATSTADDGSYTGGDDDAVPF